MGSVYPGQEFLAALTQLCRAYKVRIEVEGGRIYVWSVEMYGWHLVFEAVECGVLVNAAAIGEGWRMALGTDGSPGPVDSMGEDD